VAPSLFGSKTAPGLDEVHGELEDAEVWLAPPAAWVGAAHIRDSDVASGSSAAAVAVLDDTP
jgi:hypothetical protein